MLTQVGDDRTVERLDRGVERPDNPDVAQHGIPAGLGLGAVGDALGGRAQPLDQLGGGSPARIPVFGQKACIRFSPRTRADAGVG